ncbi:hypothetical protein AVEN_209761-1 [Araneus ventricosus]|uniref:Uncharacterized protein n=1 Tax=Araneus ventricosus TaxID=182803 RepID=A0A4Y2CFG7_ARAVE|nr:hypothetical protein AVEN_209761-1 [Araneus ventricosus]
MFTPCKVEIVCYAPEQVGLKLPQQTKHNKQRNVEILPDLDLISNAVENMLGLTDVVRLAYILFEVFSPSNGNCIRPSRAATVIKKHR